MSGDNDELNKKLQAALDRLTIEAYLRRGRVHQAAETEALRKAWPDAFRKWVEERSEANEFAEENIRGELLIRGVEVSGNDAPEAQERLRKEIEAHGPPVAEEMTDHPALQQLIAEMNKKPN